MAWSRATTWEAGPWSGRLARGLGATVITHASIERKKNGTFSITNFNHGGFCARLAGGRFESF